MSLPSPFMLLLVLVLVLAGRATARPAYQTKYFEQVLDHFRFDNLPEASWSQRYLYSDEYWGSGTKGVDFKFSGNCPGPILFYSGNEGPIDAFWKSNGFMRELAAKWGGLLIFAEHRYYGTSLPFGKKSLTPDNAVFLSTEQALADYATLLTELKSSILPNATDCPVISFGGSYGGTLTTYFRLKYPQVVIGGLAASAPIGYYANGGWESHGIDEFTWIDIVNKVYAEAEAGCLDHLRRATQLIDSTGVTEGGRNQLAETFHLCAPLSSNEPLTDWFTDAIETLPQLNYPYAVGTNPAWPVNKTCSIIAKGIAQDSDEALLHAAATITDFYYSRSPDACVSGQGQGLIPGGGPGPPSWGSWSYQSCTETLHQFSARGLRNFTFSMQAANEACEKYYGVVPRPAWTEMHFGGYAIGDGLTGASNIIFSNGLLDPWHGGGFLKQTKESLPVLIMPHGAHHLDLRGSHADDPPDVTETRQIECQIMEGWIREYVAKRVS